MTTFFMLFCHYRVVRKVYKEWLLKIKVKELKLFEMFTGYGGASFSLKKGRIPFECVGYSEIKKSAIKIYNNNFPNIKNYGDCTKIDPTILPTFNLLTAGFPCQDVSIAGKNNLQKGRTILFNEIIRIVSIKKPRYMLLENVKGILQKKHNSFFNHIKQELSRLGYFVHIEVLNSKDYGIPQNRERVFFICFKNKKEYNNFKVPVKQNLTLKVEDILEKIVDRPLTKNKRIDKILQSPTNKSNPIFELKGDTPSGVSRQTDRIYTTLSPCLNCTLKENKFFINNEVIVLMGKEHFRLQGFLRTKIDLKGMSENELKDLSGDGWDINLVSKIFKNMFKHL